MIRPSSSQNAIESGISVSFIQNVPTTGSSHTNAMPSYGERLSRPISPVWRSVGVSATWTSSETVPSSVPIDSVANAFGSETSSADPHATAALSIRTDDGTVSLDVQVADTPEERQTGLMGRESLSPYDGMAFVWEEPVVGTFWMKDTVIPLSIAFWDDDGRIVSILDMDPCTEDPCPTYGPDEPFVGAVEVARGTFERHGVAIGDRVELTVSNG